jgi:acetoin utilization deacetylase AcuC-like enzyme
VTASRSAATTAFLTHPACLGHQTPPGHPESPARLQVVLDALAGDEFRGLKRVRAPRARLGALARVHDRSYIRALLAAIPETGFVRIDSDTALSPGSGEAALRAAGACVQAVNLVMAGEVHNAFCAVRPPGHHAGPARAMGFCLINNVAVGAAHARAAFGLERIAIVDFDVHHGNGTEAFCAANEGYFYGSTHQSPFFPGTGKQADPQEAQAEGAGTLIVNRPLEGGAASAAFRAGFTDILLQLSRFRPDFIFISAGFDAHRDDHMAQLKLEEADFAWATEKVCEIAAKSCQGRVVSTLEGGYDLASLARSVRAHVEALMAA